MSLLAQGAPRSEETTWDPQHGRSTPHCMGHLDVQWVKHQLQPRDQQSWLGVSAAKEEGGGWAGAAWLR